LLLCQSAALLLTESSFDDILLEDVSRIGFDSALLQHPEELLRLKFLRMLRFFDSAEPFHRLPISQWNILPSRNTDSVGARYG
jgi:hypothetical protein